LAQYNLDLCAIAVRPQKAGIPDRQLRAKTQTSNMQTTKKKEPLESGPSTNQGAGLSSVEHTILFLSLDVESRPANPTL